ncbi:MAG: redoxin, partial [Actinomycetota bacterium]
MTSTIAGAEAGGCAALSFMMTRFNVTVLVVVAACSGIAVRHSMAQQRVEQRFDQLDRNGDSKVTPDELPAAAMFRRLDLDGDGAITKPEAVEAVRKGVLQGLRGAGNDPAPVPSGAGEVVAPGVEEPAVREGPRPVRPGDHGIGRRVGEIAFTDLDGTVHELARFGAGRIVVIAMTSTSCPLSKKYLPTLADLMASSGDGIAWILVDSVATDKPADMQAAARLVGRATYVPDADGRLAAAVGALSTTDVVVLTADRTVAYHGAIDDQYGLGYAIAAPRRRYLAEALAALLAGELPPVTATEAPGCAIDLPTTGPPATAVTYHGRVSRIVARHCVECHREGGVGPFALDSYDELGAHAAMVREVIDRGTMPPWFAAPTPPDAETGRIHTPWANDRSLADSEKRDLLEWLAGG